MTVDGCTWDFMIFKRCANIYKQYLLHFCNLGNIFSGVSIRYQLTSKNFIGIGCLQTFINISIFMQYDIWCMLKLNKGVFLILGIQLFRKKLITSKIKK